MVSVENTKEIFDTWRGWWIQGETNEVIEEVHTRLKNDYFSPMYEHMKLSIIEIDVSRLPYKLGIRLRKNLLAGD